ncbi:zinc finger protein 782-like [Ostrinia nubilalis]|uniref:zinc finger protein 782-like n=1 Tax=Ostrinia nubilalis TaxID=29057 RepID=UPI0030824682
MAVHIELDSDLYTYEYFLQDDVCRLCWGKDAVCEIFAKPSENQQILKNVLLEKIRECLELDIKEGTHPYKACLSCYSKIEEFYMFKQVCKETNRRLHDIFTKHSKLLNENIDYNVKIEKDDTDYSDLETKADWIIFESVNETDNDSDHSDIDVKSKPLRKKKKSSYKKLRTPTYCNICRLDLETVENLAQHNEQAHGIEEKSGMFKCFGCDKRFKHRKTRLGHEIAVCKGLKDGYKCPKCDRYLPKRGMYEAHMRDHRTQPNVELPEDIFQCFKCLTYFKTKISLQEHMAQHEPKKFVCETCGRVFSRRAYLNLHKRIHTGSKRYSCELCNYKCAQRSSFNVHMRKHTGERPFACDMCPLRCVSSSNLRAHRLRHLGAGPQYECSICNKKFGYKLSLEEHIAITHERSQSFRCSECGASYCRVRGLRRHLLAKHGKQLKYARDKTETQDRIDTQEKEIEVDRGLSQDVLQKIYQ